MPNALISIIIPVYQGEATIEACLDSVFHQTYHPFEIIVVNDGSTDRTGEMLKAYNNRILVIEQENHGRNKARNRGRRDARGDFLLFLDSDVVMIPTMLERMVAALNNHPEASYVYSSFKFGRKLFRLWPWSAGRLRRMPYIMTSSLIRAQDFPGFDESVGRLQDWDLWLTMLEVGKRGVWIPEVLFHAKPQAHGLSHWVPRWAYWIPWRFLGWAPKNISSYLRAVEHIKKKHALT